MATFEEFLRTGQIGPVALGVTPNAVMAEIGEPTHISAKSNPLLLKYGCLQLTFWKGSKEKLPQLREIVVSYYPTFEPMPAPVEFTDWAPPIAPSEKQFRDFMHEINYLPLHLVEGVSGTQLLFPSGVTALFEDRMLQSVRILQKEIKTHPPIALADEREPTVDQIVAMLDEAERAQQAGASRAALLVAWAGLEATLRRVALLQGRQGKIGVQPLVLIRELVASNAITLDEARQLEKLRQSRMASAHGLSPEPVAPGAVQSLKGVAMRLLAAFV